MSKDYFPPFIANVSKRDAPQVRGVIRGVPFVDTPREKLETVIISRASWEEVKKSAHDAKTSAYSACVVAGLTLLFAAVTAMNAWH